jgi:hypothetical protein
MSLLRPIRPLTHLLARAAVPRSFTTFRPVLTSGYGKSTGAGTQAGGQGSIDPLAGGELPAYSGPSVAEKQKRGPIDQSAKGEEMKAHSEKPQPESEMEHRKKTKGTHSKTTPSQTTRGTKNIKEGHKDLTSKRTFSTYSKRKVVDDLKEDASRLQDELKEDASNLGDRLSNAAEKAQHAGKIAAVDAKESSQKLWDGTKGAFKAVGRDVKDAVKGTRGFSTHSSGGKAEEGQFTGAGAALDAAEGRQGGAAARRKQKKTKLASEDLDGNLKGKSTRLSAKIADVFTPMSSDSEKLKTSARRGTLRLNDSDESGDANISAPELGEDMESVKKSFLDGPQDMPQGVGKRATDDEGRPLETGTRNS